MLLPDSWRMNRYSISVSWLTVQPTCQLTHLVGQKRLSGYTVKIRISGIRRIQLIWKQRKFIRTVCLMMIPKSMIRYRLELSRSRLTIRREKSLNRCFRAIIRQVRISRLKLLSRRQYVMSFMIREHRNGI